MQILNEPFGILVDNSRIVHLIIACLSTQKLIFLREGNSVEIN